MTRKFLCCVLVLLYVSINEAAVNSYRIVFMIEFPRYRTLASSGKELRDPFLKALAHREEANRSGKMTVSI